MPKGVWPRSPSWVIMLSLDFHPRSIPLLWPPRTSPYLQPCKSVKASIRQEGCFRWRNRQLWRGLDNIYSRKHRCFWKLWKSYDAWKVHFRQEKGGRVGERTVTSRHERGRPPHEPHKRGSQRPLLPLCISSTRCMSCPGLDIGYGLGRLGRGRVQVALDCEFVIN